MYKLFQEITYERVVNIQFFIQKINFFKTSIFYAKWNKKLQKLIHYKDTGNSILLVRKEEIKIKLRSVYHIFFLKEIFNQHKIVKIKFSFLQKRCSCLYLNVKY